MLQLHQLQQLAVRRANEIAELQNFFRNASLPLNIADSLPTLTSRIQNERSFRRDLISHLWIISNTDVPPMPLPELLGLLTVAAAGVHNAANANEADAHALLRFLMDFRRSFESAAVTSPVIPIRPAAVAAPTATSEHPAPAFAPVLLSRNAPISTQPDFHSNSEEEIENDRRPLIGVIVAACLVIGLSLILWLRHPSAAENAVAVAPSTQPAATIVTHDEVAPATPSPASAATAAVQPSRAAQRNTAAPTAHAATITRKPSPFVATDQPSVTSTSVRPQPSPRSYSHPTSQPAQPPPASRRAATSHVAPTPVTPKTATAPSVAKVQPVDLGTEADTTQPRSTTTGATVRPVSLGIMAANVTYSPAPAYPQAASAAHVQGEVKVEAEVGADGNVTSARVISGPPLLREAAISAVERWRYRPYMSEGKPITMSAVVVMDFQLP